MCLVCVLYSVTICFCLTFTVTCRWRNKLVFVFQTLFNPNKTVVKMFVVVYDLSDMPPNCQTFLRQRTLYMPVKGSPSDTPNFMVYLRYLIHLRSVLIAFYGYVQLWIISLF